MKKILIITASARTAQSKSRALTETFVNLWNEIQGEAVFKFRDLSNSDIPFVNESWIQAASKKKEVRDEIDNQALKLSNFYIQELKEADCIVLGTPMYNWSIPAVLKGYIDQIIRINETWKFDSDNTENPYLGLLENKTIFLLLTRGGIGYEKGEPNAHMNFQSAYLQEVFKLIGIDNIHTIAVNGESGDQEAFAKSLETAHKTIKSLIEKEVL